MFRLIFSLMPFIFLIVGCSGSGSRSSLEGGQPNVVCDDQHQCSAGDFCIKDNGAWMCKSCRCPTGYPVCISADQCCQGSGAQKRCVDNNGNVTNPIRTTCGPGQTQCADKNAPKNCCPTASGCDDVFPNQCKITAKACADKCYGRTCCYSDSKSDFGCCPGLINSTCQKDSAGEVCLSYICNEGKTRQSSFLMEKQDFSTCKPIAFNKVGSLTGNCGLYSEVPEHVSTGKCSRDNICSLDTNACALPTE